VTDSSRASGRGGLLADWAWQGRPPPDDWQPAQQSLRHRGAEGRPAVGGDGAKGQRPG